MKIDAFHFNFQELNETIKSSEEKELDINNCMGQRYIGCGLSREKLRIRGVPGNALGAYLNGAEITVYGNAQDSVGDTMNEGTIVIHGSCGDTPGYAMRGGKIFIKENAGYRAGIHMKSYRDKCPVMVIGGSAGSFLGEYQAGGRIIVLGLGQGPDAGSDSGKSQGPGSGSDSGKASPVGYFCGTGMHGGKIFLRCSQLPSGLPDQVRAKRADSADLREIEHDIQQFCAEFALDQKRILDHPFHVLTPNTKSPYRQLYVHC